MKPWASICWHGRGYRWSIVFPNWMTLQPVDRRSYDTTERAKAALLKAAAKIGEVIPDDRIYISEWRPPEEI